MLLTQPDARALLAAVVANPEDEGARYALADWLEDHGDTRAAAVRAIRPIRLRQAVFLPDGRPLVNYASSTVDLSRQLECLRYEHDYRWIKDRTAFPGRVTWCEPEHIPETEASAACVRRIAALFSEVTP